MSSLVRVSGLSAARQGFSPVRERHSYGMDRIFVLAVGGGFMCFVQVSLSKIEVVLSEIRGILRAGRSDDSLGFADV